MIPSMSAIAAAPVDCKRSIYHSLAQEALNCASAWAYWVETLLMKSMCILFFRRMLLYLINHYKVLFYNQ